MGLTTPQPMSSVTSKEFETIINLFESKLSETKKISDGLYDSVRGLYDFQLRCDTEKEQEARPKMPDGLVTTLNTILDRIDYLNRRDSEILNHLNKLI
jgi:hypothetical protein